MRTETIKIFTFEELSQEAQQKALEKFRHTNVECLDWWTGVYENFKADTTNFDVEKIYFSGFWSPGDGAMFEYSSISEKLVHEAIDNLGIPKYKREAMKKEVCFSAKGTHSGNYYHAKCCHHVMYFEVNNTHRENIDQLFYEHHEELEDFIEDRYEDLARKLYNNLESEYEWHTSDDAVKESLINSDYEFNEDGELF